MIKGIILRKDMLKNPIHLEVDDDKLDFARAKQLADREAQKISPDPLLLAWYNGKNGKFSPPVVCCVEDKPAWLIYSESRGGSICIDINDEEFVFVYRPAD
jgi:hypothetical protein